MCSLQKLKDVLVTMDIKAQAIVVSPSVTTAKCICNVISLETNVYVMSFHQRQMYM